MKIRPVVDHPCDACSLICAPGLLLETRPGTGMFLCRSCVADLEESVFVWVRFPNTVPLERRFDGKRFKN